MKLGVFFSGGQVNNAGAQVQQPQAAASGAHAAQVNRQLQSLAPGQTIQGEVVGRNGGEVQIRVADDVVLNARVDPGMQLEMGKTMTFEVRSNGRALTLSPLFANTAADANVLKALDMASLPVNQTTVSMTGLMMEAGLPIDRNSLTQMFREANAFPGADISDLVDLHKLGLPVNEGNLAQVASYKNLTHQLVEGMHSVLDALPGAMEDMALEGSVEGAAKMFQELLGLVRELQETEAGTEPAAEGSLQEAASAAAQEGAATSGGIETGIPVEKVVIAETAGILDAESEALLSLADGGGNPGAAALAEKAPTAGGLSTPDPAAAQAGDGARAEGLFAENAGLTGELAKVIQESGGDMGRYAGLLQQLDAAARNDNLPGQAEALQKLLQQGLDDANGPLLRELVGNKAARKILTDGLSRLWTIEPREVADRGKVDELYQRLGRQLRSLNHILEQGGQTHSQAFRAVGNMAQNLDFLQQINQAYTYVQLPLRLQQGDAHGDLYVYTNKRSLAAKDGQISALLHLDMEHLGPVDVYVAMQAGKVNTRFYVQDDSMLDFLEQHMDLLTERLQKRGYDCDYAMQVRGQEEEPESGLNGLEAREKGRPIVQYAFDMRA